MKKRIFIVIIVVLSIVFFLPKSNQNNRSKTSSEKKEDATAQSAVKEETSASSSEISLEDTLDPKETIDKFLESYYNYSSETERNQATREFCNEAVQKKLHLVKPEKDIKMSSSITSTDVYSGGKYDYLALVSYTLNDNKVTPQVLKISVQEEEGKYLISAVDFPLMN
ncbi:EF0163 family protein [Lactococcus muris]|uniref:EF0163 family protein n=2 Tax=Lactococcus TaxID=1357 RepID=A0ABV4DAA4_9LACT|nr:hypothetical protein [Lactococcus garvieae]